MPNYKLFGVLFLVCWTFTTSAQLRTKIEKYPSYETVVNAFYDSYNLEEQNKLLFISFARTPKGWNLVTTDYTNAVEIKEYTFWTKHGYKKLKTFRFENQSNKELENKEKQLTPHLIRMFDIHTFYGYVGWADDIIKHLFPHIDELNDSDLYSLGRAYSAVSGKLVGLNKDASRLQMFDLSKANNNLNEDQLTLYLQNQKASQDCFFSLYQRRPNFDVLVGKIQTKYANEIMQSYFDLWSVQNEETAKSVVKQNIYPPDILTNARNYLRNCAPNAILITNGDNDTYPLWYVQVIEGFRADVTVVNSSLLLRSAYVKSLKQGMNGVVVNFSLPMQLYDSTEIFYFNEKEKELDVAKALQWLQNQKGTYSLQMPFSGFTISCPFKSDLNIKHKGIKYIFKNKITVLDMLYSNSRPVEFTQNWEESNLFYERLVLKGTVYRLDFCDNQKIDHNAFFDFLQQLETTSYSNSDNFPKKMESDDYIDIVYIRNLYSNLLTAIYDAKEIGDLERFDYYVVMFKNFLNAWVVKPEKETMVAFEQIVNE